MASLRPTTRRRGLIVAAFPKSASSHLIALLGKSAPKSRVVRAKVSQGFGHNLLNPERIPVAPAEHVVLYGHIPACRHNLESIRARMIRPTCVLALRSLPDVVVSLADHIHRDRRSPLDFDTPGLVDGFFDTLALPRPELYDLVINHTLPWYVRFLCSWLHGHHGIPLSISTFEEHTDHPKAAIGHVLDRAEIEVDHAVLESFVHSAATPRVNFNRGVSGRGTSELSSKQRVRIAELVEGVRSLRGTRLASYLTGGYAATAVSPEEVLTQKKASAEWFLEDQPIGGHESSIGPSFRAAA